MQLRKKAWNSFWILASVGVWAFALLCKQTLSGLPPIHTLEEYTPSLVTKLYDIKEQVFAELFMERRSLIPLGEIPADLKNAVIAIEDNRFARHWGIDLRGIFRASLRNLFAGKTVQGGSTITQQLAKVLFLTPEKTLTRKFKEVLVALQLERNFSKEEIMQLYMNQIYFGHGAYGVQAAARVYFGKMVTELNLAECALLAGLPRAPGIYSPFKNPKKTLERRSVVLRRMRELGFITLDQEAQASVVPLITERPPLSSGQAAYFTEHIRQMLEPKYGIDALYRGGLSIYTTLDLDMQKAAERIIEERSQKFDFEHSGSSATIKVQAALVSLDAKTGAIRAMVGGRDFKLSQFNRAVQAVRQPGSTFKPFVWAAALKEGYTASSIIDDYPVAFHYDGRIWNLLKEATDQYSIQIASVTLAPDIVWNPGNFDATYKGPMTFRRALELSRNVVSIRLIASVSPKKVVELAHEAGIKSPLQAVLSLGLGTSVINLMEMTSAFGTFANAGVRTEPFGILRVKDHEGRLLEENLPKENVALSAQLSYLVTYLLKGVVQRGTGASVRWILNRPAAGKTGTSQDMRDVWFIGYTPDLVTGAWMGYDDDTPMAEKDVTGGRTVAPWWGEYMKEATKATPARDFPAPDGIVFANIDAVTGKLALPGCPKVLLEAYFKGSEPDEFCSVDHSLPEAPKDPDEEVEVIKEEKPEQ